MSNDPDHKPNYLVDLDGTLAHYDAWKGVEHIGLPVKAMLDRVKAMLEDGKDVRIFTARVFPLTEPESVDTLPDPHKFSSMPERELQAWQATAFIREWCEKHLGRILPITCRKDFHTVELWDDRARAVVLNRGIEVDTIVAYHFVRVLEAMGYKVANGCEYGPITDLAVNEIRRMKRNFENGIADVDGAQNALEYVKGVNADDDARNLRHARTALTKGLIAMRQITGN